MNKSELIIEEIQSVLRNIDESHLLQLASVLNQSKRIFVIGEGRSGLMAKSFAMRLMHLGATVYVIGETITPSMKKGDTLLAISGSGQTKSVVWVAEKASSIECKVIAISTAEESPLSKHALNVIIIPAATKFRKENETKTIQPLGSLFDQCAHILFDTVCLYYSEMNEISNQQALQLHSNME
ncbi:6-phospho-3-hexuloisomerase [Bacillus sp. 03113]|uniref:6-phospho-3-hexuloisomerase n=1 Tax=Bacillus sp. 03113 TaxID=2578211 RepID=UPI001142E92E|nr:6-phospho-3-hexuloisomerase [Bacillus sp. 03113]